MAETKKSEPAPKMRKFIVNFEGYVEIEVDDALLKSCNTDEWRESMMPFERDEEFVEHIAYNTVINGLRLEQIDGYADQPEERVKIDWSVHNWEIEASEAK